MVAAALLATLSLGTPAACEPHVTRRVEHHAIRTAIVVCDSRGREIVVRRARRGRVIGAVSVANRRIAWAELTHGPRRWTARVYDGRIRKGRAEPAHMRVVARTGHRPAVEVVTTSGGCVAWLTGRRLLVDRGAGPARELARYADGLALEDDRTLRWWESEYVPHFADLRPWPRGVCPQRSRYKVVADSADVVVTEASYGTDASGQVVRACARATGEDPVIASGYNEVGNGIYVGVVAVRGPWVVLAKFSLSRYDPCAVSWIYAEDAIAHRRGPVGRLSGCSPQMPRAGEPIVVTETGAVAWIVRDDIRSALLTGTTNAVVELDTAAPAAITDLVADGTTVRWLHDGAPRSADLG